MDDDSVAHSGRAGGPATFCNLPVVYDDRLPPDTVLIAPRGWSPDSVPVPESWTETLRALRAEGAAIERSGVEQSVARCTITDVEQG